MNKSFPTQEVGSLSKPGWRIRGSRGEALSKEDIGDAMRWGNELDVRNLEELVKLLKRGSSTDKRKVQEWSAKYAIRLFEKAGLDIIFDGEQMRSEMYEHILRRVDGFEFLGYVKSFDYRYFNKAACISEPKYRKSFYREEFTFTLENTDREVKIPFTGAYTIADWTFNEYYERKLAGRFRNLKMRKLEAKRAFLTNFIEEVVRPEIRELVNQGAKWIQIDEPAATTNPENSEMDLFVDSFNETVRGFGCTFSLHNCYSNYEVLAKYAPELRACSQLCLEFANRDSRQTGLGKMRRGYRDIEFFEKNGFQGNYGVGVIDVHSNFIESPALIRDRILHATEIIGDSSRVYASADCGLRTRNWDISFRKLKNMVSGAKLARESLS